MYYRAVLFALVHVAFFGLVCVGHAILGYDKSVSAEGFDGSGYALSARAPQMDVGVNP